MTTGENEARRHSVDVALGSVADGTVGERARSALVGETANELLAEARAQIEQMRQSSERFRSAYAESPIGIEIYGSDGVLLDANRACLDVFGVADVEAVRGFNLFDDPNLPDNAKAKLRDGESLRIEMRFDFDLVRQPKLYETSRTGIRYLDIVITNLPSAGSTRGGYLVQVQDITDRRRTEEELAHERDLLHALMDSIPDAIYFKDTASRFIRTNLHHARDMGLASPDDVVGKTDFDILERDVARAAYADEQRIVESGQAMIAKIERYSLAGGEGRWASSTKAPVKDADGRVVGIVGISRDVTEQRLAEEALRTANEELERRVAERTAELERANEQLRIELAERRRIEGRQREFLDLAAHEMRTPVTVLMGYLQMLQRSGGHSDRENWLFGMLHAHAERLAHLVRRLGAAASIQSGELRLRPSQFDLAALVREVLAESQSHTARHELTACCEEPLLVVADRDWLRDVLFNLLDNAIKYSPRGGEVSVDARTRGDEVVVAIRDCGLGIPRQALRRLFEAGYQVAPMVRPTVGMGMGLYISQEVIKRHGGRVWVESEEGEGSTFSLALPVACRHVS